MGIIDPASLDPQERLNKFFALLSTALGILSLCASLIPLCGGSMGVAGIVLGVLGRRSENRQIAVAGIAISVLGLLIAVVYSIFIYFASLPD